MLRTSIILPDPAGFTDTSQEQMNASHFDGFMNTLSEDGENGARGSVVFVEILLLHRTNRPVLSSHRDPPGRAVVFILLAPRRSRPNGAPSPRKNSLHLNRVGGLKIRVSHDSSSEHDLLPWEEVRCLTAIYLARYASALKQSRSEEVL